MPFDTANIDSVQNSESNTCGFRHTQFSCVLFFFLFMRDYCRLWRLSIISRKLNIRC